MKDLEVKMYKFFADRGQTFDELQMCWKPAIEEFVQFCEMADAKYEKERVIEREFFEELEKKIIEEENRPPDKVATQIRIPSDGIICLDGIYSVTVMVQDGYEKVGSFNNEKEAREKWATAMNALNGKGHTAADAPETWFEAHPTQYTPDRWESK